MALKRAFFLESTDIYLFGAGVFGNSLGAFGDCVFCQFTGQQKSDSCLDFPTCDGRSLVIMSKARRFCSDSFENVIHERIHDRHSLGRDSGIGVHLLQHLVDIYSEAFLPTLLPLFFVTGSHRFLCFSSLLDGLARCLGRHDSISLINRIVAVPRLRLLFIQKGLDSRPIRLSQ